MSPKKTEIQIFDKITREGFLEGCLAVLVGPPKKNALLVGPENGTALLVGPRYGFQLKTLSFR